MAELKIFWQPAGSELDHIGTKKLLDFTDGDTPNIRVPIRMLSIDTPETYKNPRVQDEKFNKLVDWLHQGIAPINQDLSDYLSPRLATGDAGTRQEDQGNAAKTFIDDLARRRLNDRPGAGPRNLFVRVADRPFEKRGRLLAYVAPSYSREERDRMTRRERSTFNLDMVAAGWAASFVLYPNIPNELDLPILHSAAREAVQGGKGAWADPNVLTGYEFRMLDRLFEVTEDIANGREVTGHRRSGWVTRYCADMTTGTLYQPQDYFKAAPENRLFIWPEDTRQAVADLNLVPE
jgi:endonuclease YncB( thermonuclease family)